MKVFYKNKLVRIPNSSKIITLEKHLEGLSKKFGIIIKVKKFTFTSMKFQRFQQLL